jgi:hypothetical protein
VAMNTFSFTTLPTAIALLVANAQSPLTANYPTLTPAPAPSPAPPAHDTNLPPSGQTVYNLEPFPSFKASPQQLAWLRRSLRSAPDWSTPQGPCKPCPRFHSGGECHSHCPRGATHRAPQDHEVDTYLRWMRAWKQPRQNNGQPKRGGSPAPAGTDGKKVRFTPNGPTPDF